MAIFHLKIFIFMAVKVTIYLYRHVNVMLIMCLDIISTKIYDQTFAIDIVNLLH